MLGLMPAESLRVPGSRSTSRNRSHSVSRAVGMSTGSRSRFSSSAYRAASRNVTLGPCPPIRIGSHGGGKRHAVERNARSVPFGEYVLAEPEGLEPQPLGEHGQLERPPPGLLGIPPVVFVEIALGQDQPDLHPASCRRR